MDSASERTELVDFAQIDALLATAGRDGVGDILRAFWRSTDNLALQLQLQIDERNFVEAARTAHAVKGSAANVGAHKLADVARLLEIACKNCDAPAAISALREIRDAYQKTRHVLTAHIDAAA